MWYKKLSWKFSWFAKKRPISNSNFKPMVLFLIHTIIHFWLCNETFKLKEWKIIRIKEPFNCFRYYFFLDDFNVSILLLANITIGCQFFFMWLTQRTPFYLMVQLFWTFIQSKTVDCCDHFHFVGVPTMSRACQPFDRVWYAVRGFIGLVLIFCLLIYFYTDNRRK